MNLKRIALVCTGSNCLDQQHPVIAKDYLETHHQLPATFHDKINQALTAEERAEIFLNYLFDPDISVLWALRGGEGSADLLPFIHQHRDRIKAISPKMLIGLSDFTPILIYCYQEFGWPVIHGPSIVQCALNRVDQNSIVNVFSKIQDNKTSNVLSDLTPLNQAANVLEAIEGKMLGGNLSLLNISIGDIWQINCDDQILFIEDVNEKPHVVARTLKYLLRIGILDKVGAIVIGDFLSSPIGCSMEEQKKNAKHMENVFRWFASVCPFPVLKTNTIGHGKHNMAICFNSMSTLQITKK